MTALRDKELEKDFQEEKTAAAADNQPDVETKANAAAAKKAEADDGEEAEEKEKREVERMLQRGVALFVEPTSQTELKEAILSSRFKDIKGEPNKSYVLIIYD